jgi:hypothetical protein
MEKDGTMKFLPMGTGCEYIARKGAAIVSTSRDEQYGDPEITHNAIAAYWNAYLNNRFGAKLELTAYDVARMMALFKDARLDTAPSMDSFVDKQGYSGIAFTLAIRRGIIPPTDELASYSRMKAEEMRKRGAGPRE